ncbi:MAG: DNA mismatch endonuclease Vsr [Rhizobiales bacterium]|nr:DNA mismatch endonuclease Vsr [Hyphomicrobiales bacterium]
MVDTLTRRERSARMSLIRGKHSKPELLVRRLVHVMGYRYRLHTKGLPGKPDLVFRSRKKVIFVHGCFWHRHPSQKCNLARLPKSRLEFWLPKLESNRIRDIHNQKALRAAGWKILVVWECQLRDKEQLENRLWAFLEGPNAGNRTVRRGRRARARH